MKVYEVTLVHFSGACLSGGIFAAEAHRLELMCSECPREMSDFTILIVEYTLNEAINPFKEES